MAITAHFVNENVSPWVLESRLIAFRHMPGQHTGDALGHAFVDILEKYGLQHKVGQITADNASNNGKMTEVIQEILASRGIEFSRWENYIQ
jgi:hypothetical protein